MNPDEIRDRMAYHPATPDVAPKYDRLRNLMMAVAREAVAVVPDGREQSLMVTHMEEALMWGSKGIARTVPIDDKHAHVARVLPAKDA